MRNALSPAFTGSKMRMMFSLINQYTEKAVNFYKDKVKKQGGKYNIKTTFYIHANRLSKASNQSNQTMNEYEPFY